MYKLSDTPEDVQKAVDSGLINMKILFLVLSFTSALHLEKGSKHIFTRNTRSALPQSDYLAPGQLPTYGGSGLGDGATDDSESDNTGLAPQDDGTAPQDIYSIHDGGDNAPGDGYSGPGVDGSEPDDGYSGSDGEAIDDGYAGPDGEAVDDGYAGPNDEAIVDLWFNDLCRSIVLEQETEGDNVPGPADQ